MPFFVPFQKDNKVVVPSVSSGSSTSYSKMLSATTCVYEIVSETVAPKRWNDYLKHKGISGKKKS